MNCFRQVFSCLSYTLKRIYDPEPEDSQDWKHPEAHTSSLWSDVQTRQQISKPLYPLIEKALDVLKRRNIENGVAVDLGCGISPTVFNLLKRGWTVYAVDSSIHVLSDLSSQLSEEWFAKRQLILLSQNIESFELPEKVHLVIATDSLPYCNPDKMFEIFSRIKNSLLPQGIAVCSLYSSNGDKQMRQLFGAWATKKSAVEAIVRAVDFSSFVVVEELSPNQKPMQYHVIAS